jgi:hypothetical protein
MTFTVQVVLDLFLILLRVVGFLLKLAFLSLPGSVGILLFSLLLVEPLPCLIGSCPGGECRSCIFSRCLEFSDMDVALLHPQNVELKISSESMLHRVPQLPGEIAIAALLI